MNFHLICADPKFPRLIRKLFESVDAGQHAYVLFDHRGEFGAELDGMPCVRGSEAARAFYENKGPFRRVFLSGVHLGKLAGFVDALPPEVELVWVVWGHELYRIPQAGGEGLYGPLTRAFVHPGPFARIRESVGRPLYWRMSGKLARERRVLKRLDGVVAQLPAEFQLLRERGWLRPGCRHHRLPVLHLADLIDSSGQVSGGRGGDILVGNSATPSNNHLEAFERIGEWNLRGRSVVVPLSYGDPRYRDVVIRDGEKRFGSRFKPLTEFLPLKDYLSVTANCGTVIMNHRRQQAIGNIIGALWRGADVYLPERNALYAAYREWDLSVHPLGDLHESAFEAGQMEKKAGHNREILEARLGSEAVTKGYRQLLDGKEAGPA